MFNLRRRAPQDAPTVADPLPAGEDALPIAGYDRLKADRVTAVESADLHTITLAREYEMKFHRRDEVLTALARVRGERKAGGLP